MSGARVARRARRHDGDAQTSTSAAKDRVDGHDDDSTDEETFDRLPAVRDEPQQHPAAILRYSDIPADLADALRSIINRFELRTGDHVPKSIAVTSALAGEGVTTVSQAVATMLAQEMGHFVCWVDCSWLGAGSNGERQLGRPSLLDILADQSRILTAFQASPDLPQLMSLSPGPVPESKRNVIVRSPEFERLLEILADEFDHVVFDIPPVLDNPNGLALLRRADASLLVVRHRSTTVHQVQRAIEAMQPTPNLGVVLNRYHTSIPGRLRRLLHG